MINFNAKSQRRRERKERFYTLRPLRLRASALDLEIKE